MGVFMFNVFGITKIRLIYCIFSLCIILFLSMTQYSISEAMENSRIIVYCESDEELEVGDVVTIANKQISTKEKFMGVFIVPKVKRISGSNESIFGIVNRNDAVLEIYDKALLDEEISKARKQGADIIEIENIRRKSVNVKRVKGFEVVVLGIVEKCKIDTANTDIQTGDLLVFNSNSGKIEKNTDDNPKIGTILGYALGYLSKGQTDLIPVFINSR